MDDTHLQAYALRAIRESLPIDAWDRFAELIVKDRRRRQQHLAKPAPDRSWFGGLEQLHRDGYVKLPAVFSAEQAAEVRRYLEGNPVHKGPDVFAFDGQPKPLAEARQAFPMAGYRSDQVIRAPHLVDLFNDPRLIDLLEAYLGCVPTLYSMNAWWSFPANRPELVYSQYFHRDIDDWRFVTLFLFLTDVDEASGPHQVIAGSHTPDGLTQLLSRAKAQGQDLMGFNLEQSFSKPMGEELSQACERILDEAVVNVCGAAGTMHLVNTTALHRGLMPLKSPRLVAWARYGLGPTVNSSNRQHGPLAKCLVPTCLVDSPRNRFINRLLFDFDRGSE